MINVASFKGANMAQSIYLLILNSAKKGFSVFKIIVMPSKKVKNTKFGTLKRHSKH